MKELLKKELEDLTDKLQLMVKISPVKIQGKVCSIKGIILECKMQSARIGDLCQIERINKPPLLAEVVGFSECNTYLSALGPLEGVSHDTMVTLLERPHQLYVTDHLLGCVLDGFGYSLIANEMGAFPPPPNEMNIISVLRDAPLPLNRQSITESICTGFRVIDGLITLGKGQRMGLFSGAGCGKTTLLAELARNISSDVIVIGLIGERGRELREFLDNALDSITRKRTVLICATSDRSSMERVRAAFTATAIAEAFRDQGKHVLLLIDSITRFARAQREIGLALGELPGRGGLPPSVYPLLPRLLERAGKTSQGVITAIYSVLTENDAMSDPIADEIRSLIDGHIVLSRQLAEQGHYPAIDVLTSLSRTMPDVVSSEQVNHSARIRQLLSIFQQSELLIRLGEYQAGSDPLVDQAINSQVAISNFVCQALHHPVTMSESCQQLADLIK